MPPDVTAPGSLLSLLITCSFKGTLYLLCVGLIALSTSSASKRHFVWMCGFVLMGVLLVLEPLAPKWGILPDWGQASWLAYAQWWILGIWLAGAGCILLRMALGLTALFRLQRRSLPFQRQPWERLLNDCRREIGVRHGVNLLRFPGAIMPMTWGILRSFIVLPASAAFWSGNRVRAVLMHELAHVRRCDFVVTLARDLVKAVYWFNPLVWWAAREMDDDREEASDDAVLAAGHRPGDYAEHLTSVATQELEGYQPLRHDQIRPRVALANKPLIVRVRNILTPWKTRHPISWDQRCRVAALLVAILSAIAFIGPEELPQSTTLESKSLPSYAAVPEPTESHENRHPVLSAWPQPEREAVSGWRYQLGEEVASDDIKSHHNSPQVFASGADVVKNTTTTINQVATTAADVNRKPNFTNQRVPDNTRAAETAIVAGSDAYSTAPPDRSADEAPPTTDLDEILANIENVGFNGVNAFEFGEFIDTPGNGANETPLDFAAIDALFRNDPIFRDSNSNFGIASLASIEPQALDSARIGGGNAPEPGASSVAIGAQRRDSGIVSDVRLVKARITDEHHLAISFWRKPNAPTAKFRFEASADLKPDSWGWSPDLFTLANVRTTVEGRQEVTIALTKPLTESPHRFMRIRTTVFEEAGP